MTGSDHFKKRLLIPFFQKKDGMIFFENGIKIFKLKWFARNQIIHADRLFRNRRSIKENIHYVSENIRSNLPVSVLEIDRKVK
jgi:hypothetical protein